jgi:hypothetical protein
MRLSQVLTYPRSHRTIELSLRLTTSPVLSDVRRRGLAQRAGADVSAAGALINKLTPTHLRDRRRAKRCANCALSSPHQIGKQRVICLTRRNPKYAQTDTLKKADAEWRQLDEIITAGEAFDQLPAGGQIRVFQWHADHVSAGALSSDGSFVAASCRDRFHQGLGSCDGQASGIIFDPI